MLQLEKIIIHPRCEITIRHLKNVKWASQTNKSKFARSPDDAHYDAVDALKYLIRHVQFSKNPYPNDYGINMKDLYVHNPKRFYENQETQVGVFQKIFNIKGRK